MKTIHNIVHEIKGRRIGETTWGAVVTMYDYSVRCIGDCGDAYRLGSIRTLPGSERTGLPTIYAAEVWVGTEGSTEVTFHATMLKAARYVRQNGEK